MGDGADLTVDGDSRAKSLLGRSFADLIVGLVRHFTSTTASARGRRAGLGRESVGWLKRKGDLEEVNVSALATA